jgi:2-keto-4-pentenoate hydratase/2-oxohepta-3-ene-1,7-dioic acid hydratase in catechol pathway
VDGFFPLGPGLAPASRVGNPQCLRLVTNLIGRAVQDNSTKDMVFTGTPADVGYKSKPPRFLRPGDEVQVMIEHVGTLTNKVIAARLDRYRREHSARLTVHGSNKLDHLVSET